MKKIFCLIISLVVVSVAMAQVPQGIPYQAVARNSGGAILANQSIRVRFTIRDSLTAGTIVYQETFNPTTTSLGLFNVNVGTGSVVSGTFSSINWGHNAKFMQVEMDPTGGTTYIDMGTQQMMSVPYALHAERADNGNPTGTTGDILYNNGTDWVKLPAGSTGQILTMGSTGLPIWANNDTFTSVLLIGDSYGGGIVAYILQPEDPGYDSAVQHGLIAAPINQSDAVAWWNGSYIVTGATGTNIGTGMENTNTIVASQGAGSYASKLCYDLVLGGHSDWYLPSKDELHKLYLNQSSIGGFTSTNDYASSSEFDANRFWSHDTPADIQYSNLKNYHYCVRAVRSF